MSIARREALNRYPVAKRRGPRTAYDLVVSYTAHGEDKQAARVYAESRLSMKRYLQAVSEGRKGKAAQ